MANFDFAVWRTEFGGLVCMGAQGIFLFVKRPSCKGYKCGDVMPPEWSRVPANDLARMDNELIQQESGQVTA